MARICRSLFTLAACVCFAGFAVVFVQYPYLCLLLIAGLGWKWTGRHRPSTSHGSARLASLGDLLRAGLIGRGEGLILGSTAYTERPSRWRALRALLSPKVDAGLACRMVLAAWFRRLDSGYIRVKQFTHLLTVAPSGAGKNVAALSINLLTYRGACVVVDPKGELYRICSWVRRNIFGHRVFRIDPFGVAGPAETSDCLNPLDFINELALDFIDECRALVELMILRKGTEPDPHWIERAGDILAAFIAFVCAMEPNAAERNLKLVLTLVSSPRSYRDVIKAMQAIPEFHGVLELLGDKLTWLKERELAGVLSTLSRQIGWLESPTVSRCISSSTFDPRWLWSGKVDVFLVLPHDRLTTLAPLMRLWLGTLMRLVAKGGVEQRHEVLFMIDEAAHLGRMQPLEDALSLLRGYGVRVWLFLQSLDQLKKTYGESASIILDNIGTQQVFGINSPETAEHYSKRIGDATILVESINRNISYSRPTGMGPGAQQQHGNVSVSQGYSIAEQGRRVIRPEEFLILPESVALIFHRNLPPIAARLVRYFETPGFTEGKGGQERRPGIAALAWAGLAVAASLVFLVLTLCIPSPADLQRWAASPASPEAERMFGPAIRAGGYPPPDEPVTQWHFELPARQSPSPRSYPYPPLRRR